MRDFFADSDVNRKMKTTLTFLCLLATYPTLAQLPQLRPEVVELYRLQDIAMRSRVLKSDDFVEKHEAFFSHPLFCETAFGFEYINFVEALLIRGELDMAEEYLLKSARLNYMNVSNMLEFIFRKRKPATWPDTVYLVQRTPENIRFKETMLEKISEIEKNLIIDPRVISIAQELKEMFKKDQAVRVAKPFCEDAMVKVDRANIERIKELIVENPDIDIFNIYLLSDRSEAAGISFHLWLIFWHQRGSLVFWTDFEPYFRERAENGKGLDYCFWYDTYLVFTRPSQDPCYGLQPLRNTPFRLSIVDNLDEINDNREKVGLLPLRR